MASVRHFALSAVGRDRPGIVAEVSAALLAHGANVEDSQMTILRGHFTMMLVVAAPPALDADALRSDLERVRDGLGLEALALSELDEIDPTREPTPSLMVTVYGADHPGILHAFSAAMADRGIDITDLNTRLAGEDEIYALMMEVALPAGTDERELDEALRRLAAKEGVDVTVRTLGSDVL